MAHPKVRSGKNPFPYGSNYDRGISLNRVLGIASDPRGLTEGETYVEVTLHKNYEEHARTSPVDAERTIYIKASLMGVVGTAGVPIVTIRLGQSFQTSEVSTSGQVAGVVSAQGLVGIFSWRFGTAAVEWFPDSAMTVFNEPLTPAVVNGTPWGGSNGYAEAVGGTPLYYFLWDAVNIRLNGPVRRVLPEETTAAESSGGRAYGVFVPLDVENIPLTPLPAIIQPTDGLLEACGGYVVEASTIAILSTEDSSVQVGSAAFSDISSWGPAQEFVPTNHAIGEYVDGNYTLGDSFDYRTDFSDATSHVSGYFFYGWYDPGLAVDDPSQNTNRVLLSTPTELAQVFLLSDNLAFAGGSAETPNELYLNLSPAYGSPPALSAVISFTLDDEPLDLDGSGSALLATAYTTGTAVYCSGAFYRSMWVTFVPARNLKYHPLPDGSGDGQYLIWDNTLGEWKAGVGPTGSTGSLVDGTNNGQILVWSAGATAWVPGAYGATADQVLRWSGSGWTAGANTAMPTGADKSTIFFDGPGGTGAWTQNPILQWDKYVNSGGASIGGNLIIDLTSCDTRPWNLPMPGIVMRHPAGGTCGLFANIESGENAGPRMDMGWGGTGGGNFELYSNAHGTRPGEFRIIYGPTGHIAFTNFRGGSDWEVTAGLTKEGRFFCGFNDTGFPGKGDTYGSYVEPAYPFQVYNEASHECKIVSGTTKEGRGFFGLGGTMPTAGVEHPVEVYNESSTPSRVVYISKAGKIETRAVVSGSTHVARLDCADVAFTTGATAQAIQLREMIMPYPSGGAVKGKLTQVLCGAGYGEELSLGGTPTAPASPTQLLPTSTPTEAAYNDTWAAATLGVTISLETRSAYFDTSDKKVYGYKRLFTYTKEGALFSVGAEQRYEIFVPVTIQWPT